MGARVVLAMSGGVDSSVAAYLLKKQGYEVIGLFMRTGVHGHEDDSTPPHPTLSPRGRREQNPQGRGEHKKGCCSALDAGDARRVADRLDLPFYALDFEEDFGRIMDYFVDEYLQGRTPNPCVVCNNWLKFGKLWSYGKQLDADYVATGHYAQIVNPPPPLPLSPKGRGGVEAPSPCPLPQGERGEWPELHRGADDGKDQSYVLFGLRRSLLQHLLFPIGGLRKDEVRAMARELGLPVADKPDSVEICFVPDNDHASFIRRRRPELQTAGQFVDASGKVLAEHEGYEKYTIGQRKGLNYAAGSRKYVLDIIPETRQVVLGEREDLLASGLTASRVNWLIEPPTGLIMCQAKIRYRHQPAPARVIPLTESQVRVEFAEPQSAVTPGQAVVFYEGTWVLGGGWIDTACPHG